METIETTETKFSELSEYLHFFVCDKYESPRGALEYSICIPAHGAVIGAWFGAWPMPLDWERPWQVSIFLLIYHTKKFQHDFREHCHIHFAMQEWPVCVTYGMAGGFIIGEIVSIVLVLSNAKKNED